jgi:hypothetical protein
MGEAPLSTSGRDPCEVCTDACPPEWPEPLRPYRRVCVVTSLTRERHLLRPYRRPMPRVLGS